MKDWIPLLKELVWPAFWAVALLCAWRPLRRLLRACEERIAAGAEFEAGAKGIRVGAAPKLAEVQPAPAAPTGATKQKSPGALTPGELYLVHTARRDRSLDQGDRQYFRVRIYLDADDPPLLDEVSQVTYYLHETATEPVRIVRDRQTSFEVRIILWGEFNVAAAVRFKDGREVITLERYLNL
jgi:hypothetical protein